MSTSSRPRVPDGLRDLMKDLTREILKEKPNDIYDFAANYFQTRLPQKENYAVRAFESNTNKYDFSYIQNPQRYQVPVALVYSIVPEGLTNLIKDLIKAILREQPENLCDFAVEYFRHLKIATPEVDTNEISYKTYDNYFKNKERFLFTPYVKCTCGRTLGEGFGSSYQLDHLSTIHHDVHRNDSSYEPETTTTLLEDTNNNHVKAGQKKDTIDSEKYIKAVFVIQRFFRRFLKIEKNNNLSTSKHSATQKTGMNEDGGGGSKVTEKLLVAQNNEIGPVVPLLQMNHNEYDNISETGSYTSASTAVMSASESGRETSEISNSENMLRKTTVERKEIENFSNFPTRTEIMSMENSTHSDGNQDNEGHTVAIATKESETTVHNQEFNESVEIHTTIPNKDHGVNKNQTEGNSTNTTDVKDDSLNNITSSDTKNYKEQQRETTNDKILHENSNQYCNEDDTDGSMKKFYETEDLKEEHTESSLPNDQPTEPETNFVVRELLREPQNDIITSPNENQEKRAVVKRDTKSIGNDVKGGKENGTKSTEQIVRESAEFLLQSDSDKQKESDSSTKDNDQVIISNESHHENDSSKRKEEDSHLRQADNLSTNEKKGNDGSVTETDKLVLNKTQLDFAENKSSYKDLTKNSNKHELGSDNQQKYLSDSNKNRSETNLIKDMSELSADHNIDKEHDSVDENDEKIQDHDANEIPNENPVVILKFPNKAKKYSSDSNFENEANYLNNKVNICSDNDITTEPDVSANKYEDETKAEHTNQVESIGKEEDIITEYKESHDTESKSENHAELILNELKQQQNKPSANESNQENIETPGREKEVINIVTNPNQINEMQTKNENDLVKTIELQDTYKNTNINKMELYEGESENEDINKSVPICELKGVKELDKPNDENTTMLSKNDKNNKSVSNEAIIREGEKLQPEDQKESESHGHIHIKEKELEKRNDGDITQLRSPSCNDAENSKDDKNNKSFSTDDTTIKEENLQPHDQKESDSHNQLYIKEKELDTPNDDGISKLRATLRNEVDKSEDYKNKSIPYETTIMEAEEMQTNNDTKSDSHTQIYSKHKDLDKPNDENILQLRETPCIESETSKVEKNYNSISNETAILKTQELQPYDQKESDSHNQIYTKEKELATPNDVYITKLSATSRNENDTSENEKNNYKSISNEDKIMTESDEKKESASIIEKELGTSNDKNITKLGATSSSETENSKDDTNTKSLSNVATIMKEDKLQSANQNEFDSHEQKYIKEIELGTPNDEDLTKLKATSRSENESSKDDKNNKSVSNEDKIMKEENLQSDVQKEIDYHEQKYIKEKELGTPSNGDITELKATLDETETSKDGKTKCISNDASELQLNYNVSDSHEQIYLEENELGKLSDGDITKLTTTSLRGTEISKDDTNTKYISNEATIMKEHKLESDNQKESDSHEQKYIKAKELGSSNYEDIPKLKAASRNETETSKDELQPNNDESHPDEKIYLREEDLDKLTDEDTTKLRTISHSETETSKDKLQTDNSNESDSHEEKYIKEKELDILNDEDIPKLKATSRNETETSKDDTNNESISIEVTIKKEDKPESDNQKESDSHEQNYIKDKELGTSYDEDIPKLKTASRNKTETSKDELQPNYNDESHPDEKIYLREEDLNKLTDEDTTKLRTISHSETETSKDKLQTDNSNESDSHEEKYIKEKELDILNDEYINKLRATSRNDSETNEDEKNNKSISNKDKIMKEEKLQPDDQRESDVHELKYIKDKELGASYDEDIPKLKATSRNETEISKDDTNNEPISIEVTIKKEDKPESDNQKESDSHEQNYIKDKELGTSNDEDIPKLKTASRNETETSKDELQPSNNDESHPDEKIYLREEDLDKLTDEDTTKLRTISHSETETSKDKLQTDNNNESDSHEEKYIKEKELDILNDEDITKLRATSRNDSETNEDEKNNKSISNKDKIMKEEKLQPDDQRESDVHELKYIKDKELGASYDEDIPKLKATSRNETETSKDDTNNEPISIEVTIKKEDKPESDNQKESDSHEQNYIKDKELGTSNDEDITKLKKTSHSETETSKDELQTNNESETHEQKFIKENELDIINDEHITKLRASSRSETEASKDGTYNESISIEATIMKDDKLHSDNLIESDSHEQKYIKEKELGTSNDVGIANLSAPSQNETSTSKDNKNKAISNEATSMKAEELQPNDQNESNSLEQRHLKHNDLANPNNEDITQLKETPETETNKDDKNTKSISNELQPDDQKESDSNNQIYMTTPMNLERTSTKNKSNAGEIVDDLSYNKDIIIPNQIEVQKMQSNESFVKELNELTDQNSKETQGDHQQSQTATMRVAGLESAEQIENNDKSIVKDEFNKDKPEDSKASSTLCESDIDKQSLTSTENASNENDVMKLQQITSISNTEQHDKLNNESLKSNNESPQEFSNEINTHMGNNLNKVTELRSKMNESAVFGNEEYKNTQDVKCNNLPETEIKNQEPREIYNEEVSGTTSCINKSDLDQQNKVVSNSSHSEQMEPKPDNLPNDTISSNQTHKLNVEENVQITKLNENKEGNYHNDSNNCSTTKSTAITNEPPATVNHQELQSKHEILTDHKGKEDNEIEIQKFNANIDNKQPDIRKDRKDTTDVENATDAEMNIDCLAEEIEKINVDNVASTSMLRGLLTQETCEVNESNSHEVHTIQEKNKIDNNESNLESNEYVRKNLKTDIDEAVHRILTERLKELRIQNEQKVLGRDDSEKNISSSNENDTDRDGNEKSQIIAESETYLSENRGDKKEESNESPNEPEIYQDVVNDHSENAKPSNVNRLRRSLSKNEKQNLEDNAENVESLHNREKKHLEDVELENDQPNPEDNTKNNTSTKMSTDQVENQELSNDKTIANLVESENKNENESDQETTLHNIGNKSPETLIGNQNLNIGRIRNYNKGLMESISGQRFAETHLKSFWKEFQMNNDKPLDQYDCGGNEKALAINEQALTEKNNRPLNDNLEMVTHTAAKINVDSMVNQENSPVESSNNQNISEGIEDANANYNDINYNKNIERIPRYFYGSIPIVAEHNLLEKRKAVYGEPTAFTIPLEKSTKLKNYRKPSTINTNSSETERIFDNKEINLDNCPDVEPLLDSETPTKLFNELREFEYDETHDIDLEITYTIDEIVRLKTEHDSQKNSDEEAEFERNEYSPIIIRLTAKNESQPISDEEKDESCIDLSEFSSTPESMLQTIVELSESETPRPDSKTMISSPALLQPNAEDYLTNLEKISNTTSTSWTSDSKEGEDYSFVSDEFLEDENYHKQISPTTKTVSNKTQGGIYEYINGKITEEVQTDLKEYEDLIKEAPSPPNDDPDYGDAIEKAAYCETPQRKQEVSTENHEYSDEIINGERSLLMAVCTIQRFFRNYQLRKSQIVHNNSAAMNIDQPEKQLETTNNEYSNGIAKDGQIILNAVYIIQKAFRKYQLRKTQMVLNNYETINTDQPEKQPETTSNEYSNEIAKDGQTLLNAVYIIQKAFRKYQLRKTHINQNNSATISHESSQFTDHSKNNMAAIVIQKAFRHYLDNKLKSNNGQESNAIFNKNSVNSPINDVTDDKNENKNFILEEISKRKDEMKNTIIETQQNSFGNDEECISNLSEPNLSQNATDTRKSSDLSSIILNMLIGKFINSERQYSDAVNQHYITFEEPHKEIKSTVVLDEPFMNHSVSRSILSSEGETNEGNTASLTKEIVENNEDGERVGSAIIGKSAKNQIATNNENYILENSKNSNNNPIETLMDLVENPDGSSEIVNTGNDDLTRNKVDILVPTNTDAMKKPCEIVKGIPNENVSHDNQTSSRSKESSQELAATIIQKAFRSYLQTKNMNKPYESELFSNKGADFQPTAPTQDDLNSCSVSTSNSPAIKEQPRASEEQAAKINENTSSDLSPTWFVGDEPIIANETLLRSPSEISFDETEAYVELKDSPQYSVDLYSNLEKSDANNLSSSPTAPVSYRRNSNSSSVDLSTVNKTNLSEEIVSVAGTGVNAAQLTNMNQEYPDVTQKDSSDLLANDGESLKQINDDTLVAFHQENQASNEKLEIAKLQNLTHQFINSERQYSDDVNQSNPSILKPIDFIDMHIDVVDSQKAFSDSIIPCEEIEELCIKKTVSKSLIINDSNDEELSTSSDMDNDTEDSLSMKTVKLHEPEEAIEKMKLRKDSTTKISNLENSKNYNFNEPLVEPIDNLDEDGIVVCKLKREETRESSAQSEEDVVIGENTQTLAFFETIDFDTQFPAKGSLKRVHTIAGEADAKFLLKNVTIDESIKYIEPPDFEVNSGSFCLDDATSQNIRRNMLAYSISEADSDYSDKNLNNHGNTSLESKSQKYDDFNVSTALVNNEDTSTETESSIVSAVTKIQAGTRGYLTRKRLGRTGNTSDHKSMAQDENSKASFGNAAISESLEHLVQDAAAKRIQKVYRNHYRRKLAQLNRNNEIISPDLTTSMESSLAQKRSIMLQRGDALRNGSTPDEGNSSSNGSDEQKAKIKITGESKAKYIIKQQTEVKSTAESQSSSSQAKMTAAAIRANKIEENKKRWLVMRQNSMPVQIDSEVLRVIPKHMRKKIKSAEGEKKRNGRRRRVLKD